MAGLAPPSYKRKEPPHQVTMHRLPRSDRLHRRRPLARLLPVTLVVAVLAAPASATWSIVVANRATGEVGLAAATCLIADNLKQGLTCVIAGKGAGANQYAGVASNIVAMGEGFRQDLPPADILDLVLANEPFNAQLQTGIVSLHGGPPVVFTGGAVDPARLAIAGESGDLSYAIQGNSLAGQEVIEAAEEALLTHDGDLGQKLLAAMQAAREFGGDGRCSCEFANPTACGSPPPEFEKSAHVAILSVARIGDQPAPCTGTSNCVSGSYYLFRNIKGNDALPNDPDPVEQLHERYANWRADKIGRPDGILSEVGSVASMPADGVTSRIVTVRLRDIEGDPLTAGGADVRVEALDGARQYASLGPVVDHGDGTYSFKLEAGREPGDDTFVITAADDELTATLYPYLEVRSDPPRAVHVGVDAISARRGGPLPFVVSEPGRGGAAYLLFARVLADRATSLGALPPAFDWSGVLVGDTAVLDPGGRAEPTLSVPPHLLDALVGSRLEWRTLVFDGTGATISEPALLRVER